jgi:hypothetical protein
MEKVVILWHLVNFISKRPLFHLQAFFVPHFSEARASRLRFIKAQAIVTMGT